MKLKKYIYGVTLGVCSLTLTSCYNSENEFPDNEGGTTAYFAYQFPVRTRAGLPGVKEAWEQFGKDPSKATTKEGLRDIVRNERMNEFYLENQNFWDMRRWQMPLDETVKGMQVDRNDEGELSYNIIDVEERKYDSSYQWYGPIPEGEVLNWSNLKQNKGWQSKTK